MAMMDVDSPKPNPPKPLSGRFPGLSPPATGATPATSITPGRDPRRAGAARPSVDPQSIARPSRPAPNSPVPATSSNLSPKTASLPPLNTTVSVPRPTKIQHTPSRSNPLPILDLINSLIKVNKDEEEKVRLEKEKASLTKSLQRAKQFPQFSSAITSYQCQLDKVQDELANHTKAMSQHKSLSEKAQNNFTTVFSQPKPHPELEQMPDKVKKLEFELSELKTAHDSFATKDPSEQLRKALEDIEKFRTTTRSSEQDLTEFRGRLQSIEASLEGCAKESGVLEQPMIHMHPIAKSVDYQADPDGKLKSRVSQLEADMNEPGKKAEEKLAILEQMVQEVEDNLKVSNEKLDERIFAMEGGLKHSDEHHGKRLSEIEENLKKLKSDRERLAKDKSTNFAQIGTDLDAQKQQIEKKIATQENLVNSLKAQRQNIANGSLVSSQAQTPTTQGVGEPRFTQLVREVKKHDELLKGIQRIHSDAHDAHFKEMTKVHNTQKSNEELWTTKYNETLGKVDGLTNQIKGLATKQECQAISTQVQTHLGQHRTQIQTQLGQQLEEINRNPQAVNEISETVSKLEGWVDGHKTAIRSLEQRWQNTTSEGLVLNMARAMNEMYPSVGQFGQQLKDHRTVMDNKFSKLETGNNSFKAEMQNLLGEIRNDQKELKKAKADLAEAKTVIEKAQANVKAHENAKSPQAETNNSQKAQLSPEQLKALEDLPILRQKVSGLENNLGRIETTISNHGIDLQQRLQQMSRLENHIQTQTISFEDLSEKVDQQQGGYEDVAKSTEKIDPLSQKVDGHAEELKKVLKEVKDLGEAAQKRNAEINDLNALRSRLDSLESLNQAAKERDAADTNGLNELCSRLDTLEGWRETAAEQGTTDNNVIEELRSRLKELEDLNESGGQLNASLKKDLDPQTGTSQARTAHEKELDEKMRGFLKRLRTAEDFMKTLGFDPKSPPASNPPDSEKPADQSTDKRETPQPSQNGRSLTPSRPATTSISSTFPLGPSTGDRQSMNPAGPANKNRSPVNPPKEPRQKSQTPSAPRSSQLNSRQTSRSRDFAKSRLVQNIKGKRRRDSEGADSEKSTSQSSPAPSSSAASLSGDLSTGLSRKERKIARKKPVKEEADKAAKKATKKRKMH